MVINQGPAVEMKTRRTNIVEFVVGQLGRDTIDGLACTFGAAAALSRELPAIDFSFIYETGVGVGQASA